MTLDDPELLAAVAGLEIKVNCVQQKQVISNTFLNTILKHQQKKPRKKLQITQTLNSLTSALFDSAVIAQC